MPGFDKVIIASGPTLEPIDPVRFISNRSSGKTGYQLAEAAKQRSIKRIIFITGPTSFLPRDVELVLVETASEMRREIMRVRNGADVIIMAAAVGDFRVSSYSPEKIKKRTGHRSLTLHLTANPDILKSLGKSKTRGQLLVGFAAETGCTLVNAQKKLEEKNADLIVANEISAANPAFGTDENEVYLVSRSETKKVSRRSKARIAAAIWDEIERLAATSP